MTYFIAKCKSTWFLSANKIDQFINGLNSSEQSNKTVARLKSTTYFEILPSSVSWYQQYHFQNKFLPYGDLAF